MQSLPSYRPTVLPSVGLALLFAIIACARIEPPPGGPPDNTPPNLVSVRPESLAIYRDFDGAVEFRFDEVISEGGQANMGLGTGDLEKLIILSPTTRVPKVSWKRNAISVEPREGWEPNRVYRIELRPGVIDLRRNRLDSGTVITFTTGAPIPDARLTGSVIDWAGGRMAVTGLVEAILLPDSLGYRGITDSSGRFDLGPLPRGRYLVFGVLDQNRNLRRDARDGFDSVLVTTDSATPAVLWAALRDTVGPRLTAAAPADSTGAELTFSQPVDPYQRFEPTNATVVLGTADSTPVPVVSLLPKWADDSIVQQQRRATDTTARDSTRPAIDSARARELDRLRQGGRAGQDTLGRALLASRPPLTDRMVLRLGQVLQPGSRYVIQVTGIRNLNGAMADSRQLLTIPERPPPADSVKVAPASTTRPPR
jgi:hypothetical protein